MICLLDFYDFINFICSSPFLLFVFVFRFWFLLVLFLDQLRRMSSSSLTSSEYLRAFGGDTEEIEQLKAVSNFLFLYIFYFLVFNLSYCSFCSPYVTFILICLIFFTCLRTTERILKV